MSKWIKIGSAHHQVAIGGHVLDKQTGRAVKGARVQLTAIPAAFADWLNSRKKQYGEQWEAMEQRPDRMKSAADGHFYFMDLTDGDYTLTASLSGAGNRYGSAQVSVVVSRDAEGNIQATPLTNILLPSTTVKGKITNQDNDPVVMAEIRIKGSGEHAFSNSNGEYSLSGLEAGNRTILITAQGFNPLEQDISLSQGELRSFDATLVPLNS